MSKHILNRAKKHKVKHIYSGKYHFFSVENDEGKFNDVSIKVNCGCEFMGIQGVPNGKICSHFVAVCKKIAKQGAIVPNEEIKNATNENKQDKS